MNYYQPRQVDPKVDREDAGKWRYTCRNDDRVWPVGYCRSCDGHDSSDDAVQHQREYELDNATFKAGEPIETALQRHLCEHPKCEELTTSYAEVGPGMRREVFLCTAHLQRDGLADAWDGPGTVISS